MFGLLVCLLLSLGLGCFSAAASQAASPASVEYPGSLAAPLIVPGMVALDEGQQLRAARAAALSSSAAVARRMVSRTAYAHLGVASARALAARAFPDLVDHPAGVAAALPVGGRLVRYTSAHSAQVELPGGKHAVIDSLEPIASEGAPRHTTPLNLSLSDVGAAFEPKAPSARVRIAKHLSGGVELPGSGISLTALDAQGRPLGGSEGRLAGASVLYANTQVAADTLAKPTPQGFELDTLLRSVESPQELYFRVGLPAGARLEPAHDHSGTLRILKHGAVIAAISAPGALDAEGVPVPVSMSVSSAVLGVTVDHRSGDYAYPIFLDPEVRTAEENVAGYGRILLGKTWGFYNEDAPGYFSGAAGTGYKHEGEGASDEIHEAATAPGAPAGKFAFIYYNTQGQSKIYSFTATTGYTESEYYFEHTPYNPHMVENILGIFNPHSGSLEAQESWKGPYAETTSKLCSAVGCATGNVTASNDESKAIFKQATLEDREACNYPHPSECTWRGEATMRNAKVGIVQEAPPTAAWDTTDASIGGWANGMIPGKWVNSYDVALGLNGFDPGVGISRVFWSSPSNAGWHGEEVTPNADHVVQTPECQEAKCGGSPTRILAGPANLPQGEDTVNGTVEDGVGLKTTAAGIVKVDDYEPHDLQLVGLPANREVGFGTDRLTVSATDGSGSTPSSGVASIALWIDGKKIGAPNGSCSPGPCTATGTWFIRGEEYGAGTHQVTLEATDAAGNNKSQQTTITFVTSESRRLGPGSVTLTSGAFMLGATDVAVASPPASLTVERSYDSRMVGVSSEGPLGPQWQGLGFGGNQKLAKLPTGSVVFTASSGQSVMFAKEGSGFLSPAGDAGLTLKEESGGALTLSDQRGDVTKFTVPEGGSGTVLTPYTREEPGHAGSTKYTFRTVGGVTEPTQALGPVAAGVNCATLERGCRALTFSYASSTKAGESPEQWGDYAGRLASISLTAWDPSKGEHGGMNTIPVAQYAYDKQGRLRAEWDPRVEASTACGKGCPAVKTVYGYDAEGHITSVTPPGQEPWLMHYGTIQSDATPGRLLSVTRPQPSAESKLGNYLAPVTGEVPKLSMQSPAQGTELSVSTGKWEHEPLSYSYQWERCDSAGANCTIIPGATNQTYTVRYGADEEHTLTALVTATNAGGSTTAAAPASAVVPETTVSPVSPASFGSEGTGDAQFKSPSYIAVSQSRSSPLVYVTDTGNNRVEEFELGYYHGKFGEVGTGWNQLKEPTGIGVYGAFLQIADSGNKRVSLYWNTENRRGEEQNATPITGAGALGGLGVDEANNGIALVAESGERSRIDCVRDYYASCSGAELTSFGSIGSGEGQLKAPAAVAVSPRNHYIYVADTGNNRVEYFNGAPEHRGEYLGHFGGAGTGPGQFSEPRGIAVDSHGHVWVVDTGNDRIQEFSADGKYLRQVGEISGKALRELSEAQSLAQLHAKCGAREQESPKQRRAREKCERKQLRQREKQERREREKSKETERERREKELGPGQLNRPIGIAVDAAGDIYVVDSGDGRVVTWKPGKLPPEPPLPAAAPPSAGTSAVWTIDYRVPLSGSGLPNLSEGEVAKWGQKKEEVPVEATAIFPPDQPMGWPAKDYTRASISYLDIQGHTVNTAAPGGAITATEYNTSNDVVRTLSADNRAATAEGATGLDTVSSYNEDGTRLKSTLGPQHAVKLANGSPISARKITKYSYNEGEPKEGGPYALVTKATDAARNGAGEEEDVRTTNTSYSGEGWKLRKPTAVTADPGSGHLNLEHATAYDAETGSVTETRMPANTSEKSPHASEEIYYTGGENKKAEVCGGHPEWAGLTCQTRPAKQPETAGLPNLPVTTVKKYNIWDEPETSEEVVGSKTRTRTSSYDAAGRLQSSATSSSVGAALPSVTYEYSAQTGALVSQTGSDGRKITSSYNVLGQLASYADADGNTAEYTYDTDGRLTRVNDGKGTQTYSYDPTTGYLTKLEDSIGTFTATYDAEGKLRSETYPNAMTAEYTYNSVGEATALEYVKNTHCATSCPETWFKDAVVPSIDGQWMSQESTLSKQSYKYDGAGRLAQVQSTPAGKGCTTRIYAYDRDGNRTSLETREPEGSNCATKAGSVDKHSYDEADRLIDPGVAYNEFGDITALPARDAGGSPLTSNFYADNQLQNMTQHEGESQPEETIGYNLDPSGRTRETLATGKLKTSDEISHFAGPGQAPAWTASGTESTRNIPGIDGGLAAIQTNNNAPEIQLANLHGDIIATAYRSEEATVLASKADTSEFGVPATNLPPKYAWLGAIQLPTELSSGVVSMGVRSYVPQLGRFLQPDPIPGGSANAYAYTFGNPLNTFDPSGALSEYTIGGPGAALIEWAARSSEEAAAQQASENAAARAAAERLAAEEAAMSLAAYGPIGGGEGGEEWEEGEEEGGYEYAAYHQGQKSSSEEAHIEPAVLYRPLGGEEGGNEQGSNSIADWFPIFVNGRSANQCVSEDSRCPGGNRGHRPSSRCVQYGGHWVGRRCVGVPGGPNTGIKNACEMVGIGISATSIGKISSAVVRAILGGGGMSLTAACRSIG